MITTEKQTIQQIQPAGKCLGGSPRRLVTDGQTDRPTVALVDVGGLVTDGQTDGRTVALVDVGGLVTDGQTDRRTVALVDVGGLVADGQADRLMSVDL